MIKVYAPNCSSRLRYTLDFITICTKVEFEITSRTSLSSSLGEKLLNYSNEEIKADLTICPSSVLSDQAIQLLDVKQAHYKGEPCFNIDGIIDPMATIFLVLSRYEEYLPFVPDLHGRFSAKDSWMHRFGVMHKLVCDRLAFAIASEIEQRDILATADKRVQIVPTFDIDNAFAYLQKGKIRSVLSLIRDVSNKHEERIKERREVLRGTIRDPYDTYHVIEETARKGFPVRMFWLLGNYATYDKNVSWKNKALRKLIQRCHQFASIGIHPSYASGNNSRVVAKELSRLQKIIGSDVTDARQHFLRIRFPYTYNTLVKVGVQCDFTMGYADEVGFRAGTSRVFPWFDLAKNEATDLLIHPFAYMDGTLNEYLYLTPNDAMHVIRALYEEISLYGGNFTFIWHNETLNNQGKWEGWKEVFNYSLNLAQKGDG